MMAVGWVQGFIRTSGSELQRLDLHFKIMGFLCKISEDYIVIHTCRAFHRQGHCRIMNTKGKK